MYIGVIADKNGSITFEKTTYTPGFVTPGVRPDDFKNLLHRFVLLVCKDNRKTFGDPKKRCCYECDAPAIDFLSWLDYSIAPLACALVIEETLLPVCQVGGKCHRRLNRQRNNEIKAAPGVTGSKGLKTCGVCGSLSEKQCGRCKLECYCSKECQEKGWKKHKTYCKRPQGKGCRGGKK